MSSWITIIKDDISASIFFHYADDHHIRDIDLHVEQFKKFISTYHFSYKSELCEMFLYVLDKRRGRGDCEDWTAYTHVGINTKISENWDGVAKFLEEEIRNG